MRDLAQQILTAKQFQAWDLHTRGMGYLQISRALGISRESARNRVEAANRKLHPHRRRPV